MNDYWRFQLTVNSDFKLNITATLNVCLKALALTLEDLPKMGPSAYVKLDMVPL